MITIRMHGTSRNLPSGYLWAKLSKVSEYPNWVKYCRSVEVNGVHEGAVYHDVTTLLWIPFRVEHRIEKLVPGREMVIYLPLTKKGQMWHTYRFTEDGKAQILDFEVKFDFGGSFLNTTAGWILKKRWETLMRESLPELEEVIRIS